MNKLLTLCLATVGFAAPFSTSATAREVPVPAPVTAVATSLPPVVRVNETIVVRTGHHRRYRVVRRRYYRHGRYVVVTRRVYY